MRTILLSTAIAAAALTAAATPASGAPRLTDAPDQAFVVGMTGGGLARSCYLAAEARDLTDVALGECDRALTEQVLTTEDRVATHINRGILRRMRADAPGAKADFDAALALDPNQPEAWLNRGVLLFNQGATNEALQMFERAIALKTRAPALAYFGRGLANEERGDVRAAYADLRRAQALKPGWTQPAQELARYQLRRR